MREITRSVKVDLKRLIAVVVVDVDLPYWTSKVEHIVAFTAILSNICTAHAQKRLFMNFWCKFRHRRSIPWSWFPDRVQNFGDLATFSVDFFCILYADCPPYFYFRFVWPTDLESILHASTPTSIIPTKFEVDMTTHCRVIAFCLLIRHVTLWLWPLTFWPWTVAVHGESRNQPWHQVCAESRDPWVGGQKQLHFWNPRPRFAYSLYNFYWATTTISPLQAKL